MKLNHDGAMGDFLDGIGGECYRAGEEHAIPINERLGLIGPMDKLGMSPFMEETLQKLGIYEGRLNNNSKEGVQKAHNQNITVVEDERCELWQGLWTVDYEKKWLPKITH